MDRAGRIHIPGKFESTVRIDSPDCIIDYYFQWNPELRIGFSYIPTLLTWIDPFNLKGKGLQQEVVNCFFKNEQAKMRGQTHA